MDEILLEFFRVFETSFDPPTPYRGKSGTDWLVSRVWSTYLNRWLRCHYGAVQCERRLDRGRRLDAALWRASQADNCCELPMDIALEWEWDNNKVASDFVSGDFRKLLEVKARCGLAIVQTRTDGTRGSIQADETVHRLQQCYSRYRADNRPVGLIEVRRVRQTHEQVEFTCYFQEFARGAKGEIRRWSYS